MGVFGSLMKIFSYLYHFVLALFMLGVSILAWSSGTNLHIGILPWEGATLRYLLLLGALAGLLLLVLAVMRILPVLFFIWTVVVFLVLFRGYVFSPYRFDEGGFTTPVVMTFGALAAIIGGYLQIRTRRGDRIVA